jgi:hypothetical protein
MAKILKTILIAIWSIVSIIMLGLCFMLLYGMANELVLKIIQIIGNLVNKV